MFVKKGGSVVQFLPSREELDLIRDVILLPKMMTIVEKSRKEIELSDHSLKRLYLAVAEVLQDRIRGDLTVARKELKARGIKIWEDEQRPGGMEFRYHYNCRGYVHEFSITRPIVKAQISVRFGRYIARMFPSASGK
jgi:hypothetical protein